MKKLTNLFILLTLIIFTSSCDKSTTQSIVQYNLTITVTPANSGSAVPSTTTAYNAQSSVEIVAIPNDGWNFKQWSGGINSTDNPTHITMTGEMQITAEFEASQPEITIVSPASGENWSGQSDHIIQWNSMNISEAGSIEIYRNGTFINTIAENVDLTTGQYTWSPYSFVPSNTYIIKIKSDGFVWESNTFEISDSKGFWADAFAPGSDWLQNDGNWYFDDNKLKVDGPDDGLIHLVYKRLPDSHSLGTEGVLLETSLTTSGDINGIGFGIDMREDGQNKDGRPSDHYFIHMQHNYWGIFKVVNGAWETVVDWQYSANIRDNVNGSFLLRYNSDTGILTADYHYEDLQSNPPVGTDIPSLTANIGFNKFNFIELYHQGVSLSRFQYVIVEGYLDGAIFEPIPTGNQNLSITSEPSNGIRLPLKLGK